MALECRESGLRMQHLEQWVNGSLGLFDVILAAISKDPLSRTADV
jgi:hypothetical protein